MTRWRIDRSPRRGGTPSVNLRRLLPDATFVGRPGWEAAGCSTDADQVEPGQWYVAVRGDEFDGHASVGHALRRGASGVVVDRPCPEAGDRQIVVADTRAAHARLCHALAGDPAARLRTVGVAGASGTEAAASFLLAIGRAAGEVVGLAGRNRWSDGASGWDSAPDRDGPDVLAHRLAAMVDAGCEGAVIEAADAALARHELAGLPLDAAVAADLGARGGSASGAAEARRRAVARLFRGVVAGGSTVIDADDPFADPLGAVNLDARRVTFGQRHKADVRGVVDRVDPTGTTFRLLGFDREATVRLRVAGPEHVAAALAASAVAWARGVAVADVAAGLESVDALPGRLEPVEAARDRGRDVRVDEARTGPELARALAALRATVAGRIICVCGAEGHGDRAGRSGLARAAEAGSDRLILTSDNPRGEDPDQILDDLLSGLRRPARARVEPDRRRAIALALGEAGEPGDVVLIAGKGRDAHQVYSDRVVPFDDREVAARMLGNDRAISA